MRRVRGRIVRSDLVSDLSGKRLPADHDVASISCTGSGGRTVVVSGQTSELAVWRHDRSDKCCDQPMASSNAAVSAMNSFSLFLLLVYTYFRRRPLDLAIKQQRSGSLPSV